MNIGWIGTGVMGKNMLMHLKNAGHIIYIYNRTISKAISLEQENIIVCNTIEELVKSSNIIFTMVGYPKDVKEIYLDKNGIINYVHNNLFCCVDMTTSSPNLAIEIGNALKLKDVEFLDAPVSGGEIGSINKTLSIMVGGNYNCFLKIRHLLECMGNNVNYVGNLGSGMHTKMANQIAIAGTIASTCEALYYCYLNKLNPRIVLKSISSGAASSWQLINNGNNIISNNYRPGFYIKHFIKDMEIAIENNKDALEITKRVLLMYKKLASIGFENYGTQALIYYYIQNVK